MSEFDRGRLEKMIDSFAQLRLLVVGDLMLDEYIAGDVERISPEAPVPVVHVRSESIALGGAGNVVRSIVAMGAKADLSAVVGDDRAGQQTLGLLQDLGVDPSGIVVADDRPTTRKTRVIARSQQVVRFDREADTRLPNRVGEQILEILRKKASTANGVILEDYGKGLLAAPLLSEMMEFFRVAKTYVAVDPKSELLAYKGASLFKPNLREAEALVHMRIRSAEDFEHARARLRATLGEGDIVITRGSEGMSLFEGDQPVRTVHTAAREVFDVQGAGDTVIAALVLAARAGASLLEAAVIANAAAGVVVSKIGTATATAQEVKEMLPYAIAAARVDA